MAQDRWVFGFGSLMWSPGFEYEERQPALLHGWHREFTIASTKSWGSVEKPGLVVALHPGGRCRGYAFRIANSAWRQTELYLQRRERAYRHAEVPVILLERTVTALTFLSDPGHPRTAGKLDLVTMATMIAQGQGEKGRSYEYLINILSELQSMNCRIPKNLREIKDLIDNSDLG